MSEYILMVRTHTYWMTIKEYKKWSKKKEEYKKYSNGTITRTHIYFN
jgi:hypothetical protein